MKHSSESAIGEAFIENRIENCLDFGRKKRENDKEIRAREGVKVEIVGIENTYKDCEVTSNGGGSKKDDVLIDSKNSKTGKSKNTIKVGMKLQSKKRKRLETGADNIARLESDKGKEIMLLEEKYDMAAKEECFDRLSEEKVRKKRVKTGQKNSDLKKKLKKELNCNKRTVEVGLHNVNVQRRILANARERSRVHKLGEAFNMLRRVIPSYSADQKLSKLSILKIAISYITALGSLLNYEKSINERQLFESSVNECTYALQSEFGRAKGGKGTKRQKIHQTDPEGQNGDKI